MNKVMYRVTMVCKETSRAEVVIEVPDDTDKETVKKMAWAQFDKYMQFDVEQDDHTEIKKICFLLAKDNKI